MQRILILLCLLVLLLVPVFAVSLDSYNEYVVSTLPKNSEILTNGVSHIIFYYSGNRIDSFHINRKYNKNILIEPYIPKTSIKGLSSTQTFSNKIDDYVLFINCMYFNTVLGYPIGLLKVGNEIYSGSIFNRSALIIYEDTFEISQVSTNIKVNNIEVDNINQPRMSKNYLLMYNKWWGQYTPPSPVDGIQIVVDNNTVTRISSSVQSIPENGYVLVGPKRRIFMFNVGDKVTTKIDTIPSFTNALYIVSGGPTVLKNNKLHITAKEEKMGYIGDGRYNRTFACITSDNSLVLSVSSGSGLSLEDEVYIMKKFNCIDGMNFDGGTSTSGYYKKNSIQHTLSGSRRFLPMVLVVRESK